MSIDELTDEEFFKVYQSNPQVKGLVDGIQKKYHAHSSQKEQSGYDPDNKEWLSDAKETVRKIIQKQMHMAPETGHAASGHKKDEFSGFKLPSLSRPQAAVGLGLTVLVLAALSLYFPTSLATIAYTTPLY